MEPAYCGVCKIVPDLPPFPEGDMVSFADCPTEDQGDVMGCIGYKWFCNEHLAAAQALSHLKIAEAMAKLEEQYGKFDYPSKQLPLPQPKQTWWQRLRDFF